jgi:hypothetical protein
MADEVAKQEINATRGTFEFVGIISNFDKNQEYEAQTSKGNSMRTLVFNLDTAEGHSHRLQLRAYQAEKVYFSKTEVDKDGNRKNDIKEVKWNDRLKFNMEGYQPIDRVSFHKGMTKDDKGNEKRATVHKLTYDAIPEVLEEFKVGDSVHVRGNIQIEDYTTRNGNTGTAVRLVPTSIFHTGEEVDFTSEKFAEKANFTQKIIIDEVEKSGTNEATITAIIIGNQRMGRQDFIMRDDVYTQYASLLQVIKSAKKYVSMTVFGSLVNGAVKEQEASEEFVEVMGVKVPVKSNPMQRQTGGNFVREFVINGIETKEGIPQVDNGTEYTEENVQQFIDQFIRPRQEFGESTNTVEKADAEDFVF